MLRKTGLIFLDKTLFFLLRTTCTSEYWRSPSTRVTVARGLEHHQSPCHHHENTLYNISSSNNNKNTDYKVTYWCSLQVLLVGLIYVQFILDAQWWESHRSNREQNGVSLHSSFSRQIFVVSTQNQRRNQYIPKNFESQWESGMALQ
jgi:hypothetical protein